MTINSLAVNVSTPVAGLGAQTFNVVTTGLYTVQVKYFIPYVPAGSSANSASIVGQSGLTAVVALDGSTKLTIGGAATDPTPSQPYISGAVVISATAGQAITVTPASSAAVDNVPNAVKGIINIFAGE